VAQQRRNPKQTSGLARFYWVLGILAVVGLAAIGWIVIKNKTGKAAMEPIEVPGAEDPQALVAKAQGVAVGKEDAPAKLLVFSDFMCPYCAQFAAQIEPVLVTEYVNTGKLQFVYYDYPLGGAHKYSFLASRAARCAGEQNKFWEYHNLIFAHQSDWSFEQDAPVKKLIDFGSEVGLDKGKLEQCVKSDKYADIVSANHMLGERLGVGGTPTLFMNGRKLPTEMLEIAALRKLIDQTVGTGTAQ
jgi:protein-disulfide isomerase